MLLIMFCSRCCCLLPAPRVVGPLFVASCSLPILSAHFLSSSMGFLSSSPHSLLSFCPSNACYLHPKKKCWLCAPAVYFKPPNNNMHIFSKYIAFAPTPCDYVRYPLALYDWAEHWDFTCTVCGHQQLVYNTETYF